MTTVAEIRRFPVKSFQTRPVETALLGPDGIVGDRFLGLREVGTDRVLSAKAPRIGERLLSFSAEFVAEPAAGGPMPTVSMTIDGSTVSSDDPAAATALSAALDLEVELVGAGPRAMVYASEWPDIGEGFALSGIELDLPAAMAERGSFADLEPLHILTTASIAHIQERLPTSVVNADRFRPSLLIDCGDDTGLIENEWEGAIAVDRRRDDSLRLDHAPRCVMTTRAQLGLPRDNAVLQTIASENKRPFGGFGDFPSLGIYAEVVTPGPVAVGDELVFG